MGQKIRGKKQEEEKMMFRKRINKIVLLILTFMLMFPAHAAARSMIDTGRACSMVIDYNYPGGIDIPNAEFSIYRVGTVDEYSAFSPTSAYKDYPVDYSAMESPEDWNSLAYTLQGYIDRDGRKPESKAVTGADGTVRLENLKTGLYLVLGGGTLYNQYTYTPVPTLVMLPEVMLDEKGNETNTWIYDVTMSPKVERIATSDTLNIQVMKTWKNTEGISRPSSVSVDLFRDGEKFDTAVLNAKNGWVFTWDELDANYETAPDHFKAYKWSVAEQEVEDYTVEVSRNADCFVLTNTYTGVVATDPRLPQTGLLWWPVPVLLCAGIVLMVAGVLRDRKE